MKKLTITLFAMVLFLMGYNARAQMNDFTFGINLEVGFPTGDMGDVYKTGFGGNVTAQYGIDENLALLASIGYMSFGAKSISEITGVDFGDIDVPGLDHGFGSQKPPSLGAVPIRAGAKYYFGDGLIFAQAEIGAAFLNESRGTAFLYTPGVGVHFSNFEALVKYEGWSVNGGTLSFVGVTVGYYF